MDGKKLLFLHAAVMAWWAGYLSCRLLWGPKYAPALQALDLGTLIAFLAVNWAVEWKKAYPAEKGRRMAWKIGRALLFILPIGLALLKWAYGA